MPMINTDQLQPFYDLYVNGTENWGRVSKPGLDAFMDGDVDAIDADQKVVSEARAACFYAANELAERLRAEVRRAELHMNDLLPEQIQAAVSEIQNASNYAALLCAYGRLDGELRLLHRLGLLTGEQRAEYLDEGARIMSYREPALRCAQ